MSDNLLNSDRGYCMIPPHPDLLSRLRAQHLQAQPSTDSEGHGVPPQQSLPRLRGPRPPPTAAERRVRNMVFERRALRGPIRFVVYCPISSARCSSADKYSVAVVLVDFSDKPMANHSFQRFNDLFFSRGTLPTGSVTEYYAEVSNQAISLTGQVVGPFQMPKRLSEYANGNFGRGQAAPNSRTLAADALALANGNIDFRTYDNDGNGYVDAFIVVHAGTGGEQSGNVNDIWSVKWFLPNETPVDGVKVFGFLTILEDANIGVCAHELGHLLFEWPDLYDIDFGGDPSNIGIISQGIGNWCLMASGSWGRLLGNAPGTTPCHPSAWCKKNQGWVTAVRETQNRSLTLGDVKSTHQVHLLWSNDDATSKEYFLIENRQSAGFDRSLPGFGLLSKLLAL